MLLGRLPLPANFLFLVASFQVPLTLKWTTALGIREPEPCRLGPVRGRLPSAGGEREQKRRTFGRDSEPAGARNSVT